MTIFFIFFAAPVIWPFLLVRIFHSRQAARYIVNPIPKPWDVVFRGLGESWIIVHMADGRRVGGRYAKGSQASSYPADEQLYLREVWRLDEEGRFIGKVERTGGVIVGMKDVQALEFRSMRRRSDVATHNDGSSASNERLGPRVNTYSPTHGYANPANPPQGGSGVPKPPSGGNAPNATNAPNSGAGAPGTSEN